VVVAGTRRVGLALVDVPEVDTARRPCKPERVVESLVAVEVVEIGIREDNCGRVVVEDTEEVDAAVVVLDEVLEVTAGRGRVEAVSREVAVERVCNDVAVGIPAIIARTDVGRCEGAVRDDVSVVAPKRDVVGLILGLD